MKLIIAWLKKLNKPGRILLSFMIGVIISLQIEDAITPLLFGGKTFEGRSLLIQIAIRVLIVFFSSVFLLIVFYILDLLFPRQVDWCMKKIKPIMGWLNNLNESGDATNPASLYFLDQPRLRNTKVHTFGLLLGVGWAIFVIIRYFGVEDGFIFGVFNSILIPEILIKYLRAGLLLMGSGALLGYAASQNHRRQILIAATSLAAAVIIGKVLGTAIQADWLDLNNLDDGARVSFLIIGAAVIAMGISLGAYIGRKPLSLWFLAICLLLPFCLVTLLAGAESSLLALIWLFLLANAIGMLALQWLDRVTNASASVPLERAGVLSIAVGLEVMILGTLGLGLIGGTSSMGILLVLLLATALCWSPIKASLLRLRSIQWRQPVYMSAFELAAVFMLAALFLVFWISALAPEVGADALGTRVALPAIWLRQGRILPLPSLIFSYNFFAAELIYLLSMPLTGFLAAKVIQFGLAVLLVVSAYLQVFEVRHRSGLAFPLFLFWGSGIVWWQMMWGFVDVTQMFFYFACMLALSFWVVEPASVVWLIVAGISGAAATTVKLNGVGALVIAGLVVVGVTLHYRRSFLQVVRNSLYLAIPAMLCWFPWLFRAYLLTGNPLFFFANGIFKSPLFLLPDPEAGPGIWGVGLSFPQVLGVPWDIFFTPNVFGPLGTFHPLILACAVLGLVGLIYTSRRSSLWFVAGVLAFIAWLVSEQNLRYIFFGIYFLVLAFGIGLLKIQTGLTNRHHRSIVQFILLIGLIWGFTMQALRPSFWIDKQVAGPAFPTRVVFGEQSTTDYLNTFVPSINSDILCAEWLNRNYGENAKVWQMGLLRDKLYFVAPSLSNFDSVLPVSQRLTDIPLASSLQEVYQRLVAEGFTHIIYNTDYQKYKRNYLSPVEAERESLFSPAFEGAYLRLECANRGTRLYAIRPTPLSPDAVLRPGPELILNPGFEAFDPSGQPTGWYFFEGNGQPMIFSGNTVLRLQDAVLFQTIDVGEARIYELTVDFRTIDRMHDVAYVQINWFDSSGKLRLFWREAIEPSENFASYRFLQTAPEAVQTATVYLGGTNVEVDNIRLREIFP